MRLSHLSYDICDFVKFCQIVYMIIKVDVWCFCKQLVICTIYIYIYIRALTLFVSSPVMHQFFLHCICICVIVFIPSSPVKLIKVKVIQTFRNLIRKYIDI